MYTEKIVPVSQPIIVLKNYNLRIELTKKMNKKSSCYSIDFLFSIIEE